MRSQSARILVIVAAMLSVGLPPVHARQAGKQTAKKEHTFTGKVEKVDTRAKVLTVNGESVDPFRNSSGACGSSSA